MRRAATLKMLCVIRLRIVGAKVRRVVSALFDIRSTLTVRSKRQAAAMSKVR